MQGQQRLRNGQSWEERPELLPDTGQSSLVQVEKAGEGAGLGKEAKAGGGRKVR